MTPTAPASVSAAPRVARPVVIALAVCAGLIAAGTAALWAHYGTAVFVETIIAGINACF
jgi:hypothetical protein